MNNKIILLGSEGFVGKYIQNYLSKKSWDISGFDIKNGYDFSNELTIKNIMEKNNGYFLINCFAIDAKVTNEFFSKTSLNLPIDDFKEILDVNVTNVFSACRQFISTRNSGRILNISSIYGLVSPNPKLYSGSEKPIAYGVSKAAVIQLTKHFAAHFAPDFQVNCLTLGGIFSSQKKEFVETYSSNVPMGRMGTLSEISPAIEFFLSEENSYTTGENIVVDGGWTII